MKSCRSGFMRCRSREEPWGSHHVDARALKCETSSGLTEEVLWARNWFCTNRGAVLRRRLRLRREVGRRGAAITGSIGCFASRAARLGNGEVLRRRRMRMRRRFGQELKSRISVIVRADKQIILAPVSKPMQATRPPDLPRQTLQEWTGILEGTWIFSCHPHARAEPSHRSGSDTLEIFILFPR